MGLTFIQAPPTEVATTGTSLSKAFVSNVTSGSIMFALGLAVSNSITLSVADSLGNIWTQVGANQIDHTGTISFALFWATNNGGNTANTVTLHSSASVVLTLNLCEYSGQYTGGNPIDNFTFFTYGSGVVNPQVGPVTLTSSNESFLCFTRLGTGGVGGFPSFADGTIRLDAQTSNTFLEDRSVALSGNQTASWVQSGANNGGNAFAFGVFSTTSTPSSSISGNAGVGGALVSYTGTASGSVTADGSGNYVINGLNNGSYTITPTKANYTFSPVNASETISGSSITGINFTATLGIFSISGSCGAAFATVAYTGTSAGSVNADSGGNYAISNLINGSYNITPSLSGFVFSPTNINETIAGSNLTGVNFIATQTQVSTPIATPLPGTYSSSQVVTLTNTSSALPGFAMYYTTNGTTPTTGSTLYTTPILISVTTIIKAIAVATAVANSDVLTANYSIIPFVGGGVLLLE